MIRDPLWRKTRRPPNVFDCGDSGCKIFMFELDTTTGNANAIMDASYATYSAYTPSCSDDYIHVG